MLNVNFLHQSYDYAEITYTLHLHLPPKRMINNIICLYTDITHTPHLQLKSNNLNYF